MENINRRKGTLTPEIMLNSGLIKLENRRAFHFSFMPRLTLSECLDEDGSGLGRYLILFTDTAKVPIPIYKCRDGMELGSVDSEQELKDLYFGLTRRQLPDIHE